MASKDANVKVRRGGDHLGHLVGQRIICYACYLIFYNVRLLLSYLMDYLTAPLGTSAKVAGFPFVDRK